MITTTIFPGRYIQGDQALSVLPEEIRRQGTKAILIFDKSVAALADDIVQDATKQDININKVTFGGECCSEEISRLTDVFVRLSAGVVIGFGGGKTLDTAKAVAFAVGCKVILVPSIASTDAPCSALSVIYKKSGEFERYELLPHNPEVVLVDTAVITRAPVRFLVAGMGDAFATWFEAEDCRIKCGANMTGRLGSMSAYALAKLCHNTLLEFGTLAKLACENKVVTPALEHIVEANTLLSGLGFESGGLAAAHAIHNGLTAIAETHAYYHGEKVAIGLQAMMFLTDRPSKTIDLVFDFCESVGLPTCLSDIGIIEPTPEQLLLIAQGACAEGETIHNEPYEVTPRRVVHCIKAADAEGRRRKTKVLLD